MDTIPTFRKGTRGKPLILYEDEECFIVRQGEIVTLNLYAPWGDRHSDLVRRWGVDGLALLGASRPPNDSLALIPDILSLRLLSLFVTDDNLDLECIERMRELRYLHLDWGAVSSPPALDLLRLPNLDECRISLRPEYSSISQCKNLSILNILSSSNCSGIDLSRLRRLAELDIHSCREMHIKGVDSSARIRAIEVTACNHLEADWARLFRDVEYLSLGGRVGFPVENIACARNLKALSITRMRSLPSLEFLRDMPRLDSVDLIMSPTTAQNKKIIREINALGGHGGVLIIPR